MQNKLDISIEKEFLNIHKRYWKFLNNDYIYKGSPKYHRRKLSEINNIDKIKENVYNKLGSIAPFIFLTDLCNELELPGPYNNLEKGLVLLEHLISGKSMAEMDIYINESNFFNIYKKFFVKNRNKVEEWVNYKMKFCFSSIALRVLCARKFNPSTFENVTLFLDGHHSKITYQDINLNKKDLYSWKLKTSGLNTQFIIDVNKMCVYLSNSLPCKDNTDDNMFLNVNLNKFYYDADCICFDGLYQNTLQEFIIKYKNIGYNIDDKNFCYPIRKNKNVDLSIHEARHNEQLAGFRSKIETYFAEFSQVFKRFNPQNKIRITDHNLYNLQLKLCCVLLNIKYFTTLFGIQENYHFNKWRLDGFKYIDENDNIQETPSDDRSNFKLQNLEDMKAFQNIFLSTLNLDNNENEETEKDENMIKEKEKHIFEVQHIITHRGTEKNREYFVKWKNFGKDKNCWIHHTDFLETELIQEYWESINQE